MNPPASRSVRSRLLWTLLVVFLVAVSCGSSDDGDASSGSAETEAAVGDAAGGDTNDDDDGDAETDGDAGSDGDAQAGSDDSETNDSSSDASENAEAEDGPAAGAVAAPREDVVANLIVNMTTHTPTDDEVECVVSEADDVEPLGALLDSLGASDGTPVDDSGFGALTTAFNGCVDGQVLSDWAALTMGFGEGQAASDVSGCFNERFAADDGDRNFRGLAGQALGFQATDEATSASTIDTLSECVPLPALADQLSNQTEARSGFSLAVDRDCTADALGGDELTRSFWSSVVSGAGEGFAQVEEIVTGCADEFDSGLLDEVPADFEPWQATGALAGVDQSVRNGLYTEPPPMSIDPSKTYEAVIATGGGEIRLALFPETAPVTVNNFVALARDGYYDGTVFHRVIEEFMAQAGDPTGSGSGGPGYQFEDEVDDGPPLDKRGMLAMANSGPATNGSQFFITFAPTEWLTGNHTVFGELIEGDDILAAIEARDPAAPTSRGQVIESITIEES